MTYMVVSILSIIAGYMNISGWVFALFIFFTVPIYVSSKEYWFNTIRAHQSKSDYKNMLRSFSIASVPHTIGLVLKYGIGYGLFYFIEGN